ncbi:uncharacterized protein [Battus philenor]|uniref:uncharacterized protein n=1 Tax=Battus philenor TaxID=42288 RepID=UPI0035D0F66D
MDINIALLLEKMEEKMKQQTLEITTAVTKSVMEGIDKKLKNLTEENEALKTKVATLEQKLNWIEKDKRKNNLVFYGIDEMGRTENELVNYIKEIIIKTGTHMDSQEISNIYRIGQKVKNKNRPVVVTITTTWKKHIILKNKSKFPAGLYVNKDFPKEVLETRKQLQGQVKEERQKGNIAYINYDKLVVRKTTDKNREKRKRGESGSPNTPAQKKATIENESVLPQAGSSTKEIMKPSILKYVNSGRSASPGKTTKN